MNLFSCCTERISFLFSCSVSKIYRCPPSLDIIINIVYQNCNCQVVCQTEYTFFAISKAERLVLSSLCCWGPGPQLYNNNAAAIWVYHLFRSLSTLGACNGTLLLQDSGKRMDQSKSFSLFTPFCYQCIALIQSQFFAAKFVFVSLNPLLTLIVPCLMVYFAGRKIEGLRIFGLTGGIATGKSTLAMQMADKLNE